MLCDFETSEEPVLLFEVAAPFFLEVADSLAQQFVLDFKGLGDSGVPCMYFVRLRGGWSMKFAKHPQEFGRIDGTLAFIVDRGRQLSRNGVEVILIKGRTRYARKACSLTDAD